jgi:ribosomal protein S18 acetylase RimI-like enzyme
MPQQNQIPTYQPPDADMSTSGGTAIPTYSPAHAEAIPTYTPAQSTSADNIPTYVPRQSSENQDNIPTYGPNTSSGNQTTKADTPPPDPNESWLKKGWDAINNPLIDEKSIERWTGREGQAGGLEKGFYDLVSGLSSPLSLALAIGTFGSGTLFESGGMAALKAAGMGLDEIATVTKGSEVMSDAIRAGKSAQEALKAVTAAGLNPDTVQTGLEALKAAGMTGESLATHGIIRTAGAASLRALDMPVAQAEKVATGIQALVDAGFSVQNAYGAAVASPRVLDALKDGDYDTAKRLAVNAIGGAGFAFLGGRSALKDAGSLMDDVAVKSSLHVAPTEENLKLRQEFGNYDRETVSAGRAEELWAQDLRQQFKDVPKESLPRVMKLIQAEGNDQVLAERHDALAEALGQDQRIAPPRPTAINKAPVGLGIPLKVNDYSAVHQGDNFVQLEKDGKTIGYVALEKPENLPNTVAIGASEIFKDHREQGYGTALYDEAAKSAQRQGARALVSDIDGKRTEDAERMWKSLEQKLPNRVRKINDRYWLLVAPDAIADNTSSARTDALRIRELIESKKAQTGYKTPAERQALLDSYDVTKITPRERELANHIRDHFSETLEKAKAAGALADGMDGYVTHIWEKDADNPAANKLLQESKSGGFSTNTSMARKRMFDNAFEGELFGKKLAITDPIALASHNGNTFARVIEARKVLDRLQDKGTRASDGRPMVALSGSGHLVDTGDAVLTNSNTIRNLRIANKVIDGLKKTGDLGKLVSEGKIIELAKDKDGNPAYAWNAQDYRSVDHPSFTGWKYATGDTAGKPVFVKGDLRVHPDAYDYMNKRLGKETSPIEASGIGKTALAVGREAKGSLLFGSPFHFMQEGLRAVMSGISPFGIERWDLRNDPVLAKGVEQGLTLGKDYKGVTAFEEGKLAGHSKIISKIPGAAQLQTFMQEFLFDKYIPGLKARAYKALFERYRKAYPDWTLDKAAETAAADTNERFGGINYRRMGRSVATQDLLRVVSLAPDWLESEMRFMARVFGDEGKIARTDVARMAVGLWAAARIMNYITSGQPHNEAPFGVAIKDKDGKEKVYSIRTLPTDMLHAVQDPGGFLAGRASPLVRSAVQTYTGRDEFGRKLQTHDIFTNLLRNAAPIGVQTAVKVATGETPEVTNTDAAAKAAGLTVFPYRTEAQKLAAQLASDHSESGAVDQAGLRRHQALLHLEDQLRDGSITHQDVYQMVESGDLSVKEGKQATKVVQETKGMDPDMARLWSRASRLPLPDFLNVWGAATNNEKSSLAPLLIKKKQAYIKKAMTDMTPAQRQTDPTFRWVRTHFAADPLW